MLQDSINKQVILLQRERDENKKNDKNKDDKNFVPVPRSLFEFIGSPKYYNFLQALLEYCRELFRLENKQ